MSKAEIDRKVRQAKQRLLDGYFYAYGYNFCQECRMNDDVPLDCAHIISVDECQKTGRAELAWDVRNMMVLGRRCHRKHDKTYIGS